MDGRRKRGTGKHAGVVFQRRSLPSGAVSWRARYRDPDSGKDIWETLPSRLTTEEERTGWAVEKAQELNLRVTALAEGAPTKKNLPLGEVVKRFYTDNATLRPQTLRAYRLGTDAFLAWAREERIDLADNLRPDHLKALRGWLVNKPLLRQVAESKQYRAHAATVSARSPYTVNRELASIKTCLEHLRQLGLVPMLTRDGILDNLKRLKTPRPVPEYLKKGVLLKILDAAARHDAETFELTREEKNAGLKGGNTPRYEPVLPYFATVLLTGMREGEARLLRWSAVDLDAEPSGVITLRPEEVKTKHGRIVDLAVSDVLRDLLAAMRLRAGGATFVFEHEVLDEHEKRVRVVMPRSAVEATRKRLLRVPRSAVEATRKRLLPGSYGAPRFSWQQLRVTCGTFLANAPGIFGAASAYREARQLGHSVTVAEKHYLGVVHVNAEAKTLEAAMGIEKELRACLGLPVAVAKA